jgi:hypothetical protein
MLMQQPAKWAAHVAKAVFAWLCSPRVTANQDRLTGEGRASWTPAGVCSCCVWQDS